MGCVKKDLPGFPQELAEELEEIHYQQAMFIDVATNRVSFSEAGHIGFVSLGITTSQRLKAFRDKLQHYIDGCAPS